MNQAQMRGLRALLDMAEQTGATRILQAPTFGTVANATDSTPQSIVIPEPGFVTALAGQIASGAVADYGGSSLRFQIGGTEDFFVDGQGGPAFSPFLMNFGGLPAKKRVLRRVGRGDLWTFTVRNATGGGIIPTVAIDFITDKDLAAVLASIQAIAAG